MWKPRSSEFGIALSRNWWSMGASLFVLVMSACEPALQQEAQAPTPVPREERLEVLKCYADAFEIARSRKVELTREDVKAAEDLYTKVDNSTNRACKAIRATFTNSACTESATLRAIANDPNYCVVATRGWTEPSINSAKIQEWSHQIQVDMMTGREAGRALR